MKLSTLKGLAIGVMAALIVPALAATVTTVYLNGGTPGTAGHYAVFTTDGLGIQDGGGQVNKFIAASWISGMTLQAKTVPVAHFAVASTVTGAICRPEVVAGGTADADVFYTPSGTPAACGAGTKINTTACHAGTGGTAFTVQNMGTTNTAIPANSDVCAVFSNDAAWTTTAGTGFVQIATTTP